MSYNFWITLYLCHRNPYYQSSACILLPMPVGHAIVPIWVFRCPTYTQLVDGEGTWSPPLLMTHMSDPYLGPAGAFLPHMFLPGAWRGAGLPLRGRLQQDLQQVDSTFCWTCKRLCWHTGLRGGVRANIKVTRRGTTVSSMHRWVTPIKQSNKVKAIPFGWRWKNLVIRNTE